MTFTISAFWLGFILGVVITAVVIIVLALWSVRDKKPATKKRSNKKRK